MSIQKGKKKADKTILVITDFTKSSTNAILFAANLFKNSNLRINLLNTYENPNEKANILISVEDILSKDSEAGLQKQSAEVALALGKLKPAIATYSSMGKFKKIISTITRSEDIDLIVLGIHSNEHICKKLNTAPLLFIGQGKVPVLMVPENHIHTSVKNVLVLNLGVHQDKNTPDKRFEHIVNHDHIFKEVINLHEKQVNSGTLSAFYSALQKHNTDLIIIAPVAGDKIDKILLGYQFKELLPAFAAIMNC